MNIDLRNISEDFEKQVNEVKKKFDIITNSKAVEYCTVNYIAKLKEIEKLKTELSNEKQKNDVFKNKFIELNNLLAWIKKIT
ncbi:hypothetical protein B0A67_24555 [Flavobacterium aquidurense]|uniref:hypothetical protein n=1 Tax=Flavobacterium aquidurense TaxID=362413 RepID=UPI000913F6EB|nr:hypothetical protein [Flavobacterium aquidurense]OXA65306.1 hypothetical protein B0A67_24555 [Flavobacterium aquidurense]SHH88746.1 hypothetical protein SAMN05444481_1409 [Flavobacterium frigidimaris]